MFAVKGNREFAVNNETERAEYVKAGYDIVDKDGKIIEAGKGKTVSYDKYEALQKENAELKAENEKLKAGNAKLKAENEAENQKKK